MPEKDSTAFPMVYVFDEDRRELIPPRIQSSVPSPGDIIALKRRGRYVVKSIGWNWPNDDRKRVSAAVSVKLWVAS